MHFGNVMMWDKVFRTEPNTENNYLPALRNASKLNFYCRVIFLSSKGNFAFGYRKIVLFL
jgi:hypothetical protein